MALKEAKEGNAEDHFTVIKSLNDPKYKGMMKKQVHETTQDGKYVEVHYVYDPKTGNKHDFKFTRHSSETLGEREKIAESSPERDALRQIGRNKGKN